MKTPIQEHIEWLEKEYKKFDAEDNVAYWFHNRGIRQAIDHAESLLEKEKEVIKDAHLDAYIDMNMAFRGADRAEEYYNKTFKTK